MNDSVDQLVAAVRRGLAEIADPTKAPAMQAYMKSALPFRGVTSVPLRELLRSLFKEHPLPDRSAWCETVLQLWDGAEFREERYAALELTGHRLYREFQSVDTLELYRYLVSTGAWWDLVDPIASNRVGPILRAHPDSVVPLMDDWAVDGDLWIRRTAIICQLGSKAATDVDLLSRALSANLEGSLHGREFFIRKAIGWALREYAKTDPVWVQLWVTSHAADLSGLSQREALKHVGPIVAGPT